MLDIILNQLKNAKKLKTPLAEMKIMRIFAVLK